MLKETLLEIAKEAIQESLPDAAVFRALEQMDPGTGKTMIIAVGKAGWQMAKAASDALKGSYQEGYVITKYGHSMGPLHKMQIFEAGHPILDENAILATESVIAAVGRLTAEDRVLLLLSGGGSALFEKPLIPLDELADISRQLLSCGADIVEINTIRKRLSAVKGNKFAQLCAPAAVYSIILSDIVGDHPDMIASGPAYPDESPCGEALKIAEKYQLSLSSHARLLLSEEPVRALGNEHTFVTGGVGQLCQSTLQACSRHGYTSQILTDCMCCEAREAGSFLGSMAKYYAATHHKTALIAGGETIVHLRGKGLGGRNQELALAAAEQIAGLDNVAVLSMGSDGTDGPTDAAGGIVDGQTLEKLAAQGICLHSVLADNDAYHALKACGALLQTGPTGTNVNDISVILID